jgi:glycosyltransferase involved in cell wall biosynthesis
VLSIITRAFNSSGTIGRAIESVLAQDYSDWELIIVDDGSTDDTRTIVERYADERIRLIRHMTNRGNAAALNTGLDHVRGEWFTLLDHDDEIVVPDALSTLLRVPVDIDPSIDAVSCNCRDGATGEFTGHGFDHDQYLDWQTIYQKEKGEHWGLTKTALLRGDRLNESIPGMEGLLWYHINKRARRYYIHKALRIWHTEAPNRFTDVSLSDDRSYHRAIAIMNEKGYLDDCKVFGVQKYRSLMFAFGMTFVAHRDRQRALIAFRRLIECRGGVPMAIALFPGIVFGPGLQTTLRDFKHRLLKK